MDIEIRYRTVSNRLNKYRPIFLLNDSGYSLHNCIGDSPLQRPNGPQPHSHSRHGCCYGDVVYALRDDMQGLYGSCRPVHHTCSPPLLHPSRPTDVLAAATAAAAVKAVTGDMKISMAAAKALIDRLDKIYLDTDLIGEIYRMLNRLNIKQPNVITST